MTIKPGMNSDVPVESAILAPLEVQDKVHVTHVGVGFLMDIKYGD
jgi:hypothetical protein